MIKVKLEDIVNSLGFLSDESEYYLDKTTGKIHFITDEMFSYAEDEDEVDDPDFIPEWEIEGIEMAKEILSGNDKFIKLPTKFDVHEYSLMERFCLSI